MKIFDLLKEHEKLAQFAEFEPCWDLELFLEDLNLEHLSCDIDLDEFAKHVEVSGLVTWTCTDTVVGIKVYYLGEHKVAVSMQQARKCDKKLFWFDSTARFVMKKFIESIATPSHTYYNVSDIDDSMVDKMFLLQKENKKSLI